MNKFTIEQLEALKEGITPGPWAVKRETPTMQHDYFTIHRQGDHRTRIKGHTYGHGQDPDLIAASPALLDQLIAEKRAHAKLRAEIEALIRDCVSSAETFEHNAMTAYSPEACESASTVERDTAEALTRILEGDNE